MLPEQMTKCARITQSQTVSAHCERLTQWILGSPGHLLSLINPATGQYLREDQTLGDQDTEDHIYIDWRFVFSVPAGDDPTLLHFIFMSISKKISNGFYSFLDKAVLIELAGLRLQATYRDYRPTKPNEEGVLPLPSWGDPNDAWMLGDAMEESLPLIYRRDHNIHQELALSHQIHQGTTVAAAQFKYLTLANQHGLLGVFLECTEVPNTIDESDCHFGAHQGFWLRLTGKHGGISFLDRFTKKVLCEFPWMSLQRDYNCTGERDTFLMAFQDSNFKIKFYCYESAVIHRLIMDFRLRCTCCVKLIDED